MNLHCFGKVFAGNGCKIVVLPKSANGFFKAGSTAKVEVLNPIKIKKKKEVKG